MLVSMQHGSAELTYLNSEILWLGQCLYQKVRIPRCCTLDNAGAVASAKAVEALSN